mmetsp:Transcript_78500/g.220027  ORF Transcript_78500/g.220027 Transcript_78500/m.220027 type:complete len:229 (+) Transcript_78500:749-1435(+)
MARRQILQYSALNTAPPAAEVKSVEGRTRSEVGWPRCCRFGRTEFFKFAAHSWSTFQASFTVNFCDVLSLCSTSAASTLGPQTRDFKLSQDSITGWYCSAAPPAKQSSWISMRKLWKSWSCFPVNCVSSFWKCSTAMTSNILTSSNAFNIMPRVLGLAQSASRSRGRAGAPSSEAMPNREKIGHLSTNSSRTSTSSAKRPRFRVAPGAAAARGTSSQVGSCWKARSTW